MTEYCVYCRKPITNPMWLVDKFVLTWGTHVKKNEDGVKNFVTRYPKERVCRPCYFFEVKTNRISLHK